MARSDPIPDRAFRRAVKRLHDPDAEFDGVLAADVADEIGCAPVTAGDRLGDLIEIGQLERAQAMTDSGPKPAYRPATEEVEPEGPRRRRWVG